MSRMHAAGCGSACRPFLISKPSMPCLKRNASRNGRKIPHGTLPGTIAEVHAEELPSLMPLGGLFDGCVEHIMPRRSAEP